MVRRRQLPPPAASHVYELTEWGAELETVLSALGRWGARAPLAPEGTGMSCDAHILSLRTLFDPALAGGLAACFDLRLGDEHFRAEVADRALVLERGEAAEPDASVTTDHPTLLALAHRRLDLAEALRAGEIEVEGDEEAFERFVGLFTLPEPATVPS